MKLTLVTIAALLLPMPVAAHHEDVEAATFAEYVARLQDTTQNSFETITLGHEAVWHCSIRALYFDLFLYASRFWPSPIAQTAAGAARGLGDVAEDFCEATA